MGSSAGRELVSVLTCIHSDENSSYVPVRSEKRDVVGTGGPLSNGKIMTLAVVAEYRNRGDAHNRGFWREQTREMRC